MKKFLVSVLLFSSVLIVLAVAFECMQRRIPNTYRFTRGLIENRGVTSAPLSLAAVWSIAGSTLR